MSVTIDTILPGGEAPLFDGLAVSGTTAEGGQNIMIFYEIPTNGVQSANLTAVSDSDGRWGVTFAGIFREDTEVTAIARAAHERLARRTTRL